MEKFEGKSFFKQAHAISEKIEDAALNVLYDTSIIPTWHPNGFIVYRLGTFQNPDFRKALGLTEEDNTTALGQLRIHIWPDEPRKIVQRHPRIHCHSWWLYSRIIAGTYKDRLYKKFESPTTDTTQVYEHDVEYQNPECADIVPNEKTVHIKEGKKRNKPAGDYHFIAPNVFHQTTIDSDEYCATLLFMSANKPGKDTLVHPEKHDRFTVDREHLTPQQNGRVLYRLQVENRKHHMALAL